MRINLDEIVDRLCENDADDCEWEINESTKDLVVQYMLILGLDLVEELPKGTDGKDYEAEGHHDHYLEEVVDIASHYLH